MRTILTVVALSAFLVGAVCVRAGDDSPTVVTIASLVDFVPTIKKADGERVTDAERAQVLFDVLRSTEPVTVHLKAVKQLLRAQHAYFVRIRVNDEPIWEMRLVP